MPRKPWEYVMLSEWRCACRAEVQVAVRGKAARCEWLVTIRHPKQVKRVVQRLHWTVQLLRGR